MWRPLFQFEKKNWCKLISFLNSNQIKKITIQIHDGGRKQDSNTSFNGDNDDAVVASKTDITTMVLRVMDIVLHVDSDAGMRGGILLLPISIIIRIIIAYYDYG